MPASVDTHPMAQIPGHILQDAFGNIREEFIARDLRGVEVVSLGHWGGGKVGLRFIEDILLGKWVGCRGSPGV